MQKSSQLLRIAVQTVLTRHFSNTGQVSKSCQYQTDIQ